MPYVQGNARLGRDNRSIGNPAGRENLVNQVFSPAPEAPPEIGAFDTTTSCTISRSGTTATGTATAHGLAVGDFVRIAGAVQKQYNGTHRVLTVADANTFTYVVYGSPTASATGTITSRKVRRAAKGD